MLNKKYVSFLNSTINLPIIKARSIKDSNSKLKLDNLPKNLCYCTKLLLNEFKKIKIDFGSFYW